MRRRKLRSEEPVKKYIVWLWLQGDVSASHFYESNNWWDNWKTV